MSNSVSLFEKKEDDFFLGHELFQSTCDISTEKTTMALIVNFVTSITKENLDLEISELYQKRIFPLYDLVDYQIKFHYDYLPNPDLKDNGDHSVEYSESDIQGFQMTIKIGDTYLKKSIEKAYYFMNSFYEKISFKYDDEILNYSLFYEITSSLEKSLALYNHLINEKINEKHSIRLSNIRQERTILSIPIKDKYSYKTLLSILS